MKRLTSDSARLHPVLDPETDLPIADEEAWSSPPPTRERAVIYGRRPLLTREEEVELGTVIEGARRTLLEALVESPVALDELAAIAQDLKDGVIDSIELTPSASMDGREDATIADTLLDAIRDVQSARRAASGRRSARSSPAATRLVALVLEQGVSVGAVARIVARLDAALADATAAERHQIEDVRARILESHASGERAKQRFVEANFGLVMMLAARKRQGGLPLHDLAQDGCIGLMRAVDKFDHRRGVRFSTYAAWWIRHALNRALSDRSRTIRLPVHLLETRSKALRAIREFELQHGREPTERELSRRLDVPADKLRAIACMPREPLSLEAPVGSEGDARIADFVADVDGASALEELSVKHVRARLRELVTRLPKREAEVLRLRFGLDGAEPLTLKEIGEQFSLSRERIRQIEANALREMRGLACAEELDAHLLS